MPGGLTHEEAVQVAAMCRDAGANFINVSQGSYENPGAGFAPDGENDFTHWAPGFKKATGLPIIIPNFSTPDAALNALKDGSVDLVSLGRQSIADPFWPAKVKAGRIDDIVKCSRCQNCYMNLFESRWMHCLMNPTAGREKYYPKLWIDGGPLEKRAAKFVKKASGLEQI
jgi:2,4-dienoyl-CoA reductase-like NADH-dependent reductase (Old Yellow Enzyme family)